jgi:hypothetical protein
LLAALVAHLVTTGAPLATVIGRGVAPAGRALRSRAPLVLTARGRPRHASHVAHASHIAHVALAVLPGSPACWSALVAEIGWRGTGSIAVVICPSSGLRRLAAPSNAGRSIARLAERTLVRVVAEAVRGLARSTIAAHDHEKHQHDSHDHDDRAERDRDVSAQSAAAGG